MAVAFSMGSFGAYLPYPTILVGTDRLLLKGIKYAAGRMRPLLPVKKSRLLVKLESRPQSIPE